MEQAEKRLAVYLRVSSEVQAERGQGLAIQEAAVRAWARKRGHKIVGVFKDAGVSGANALDQREALPLALATVQQKRADGIVVQRIDRLSRDLITQEQLLREIRRCGGQLYSTSDAEAEFLVDDGGVDPSRALIRQVLVCCQVDSLRFWLMAVQ